MGNPFSPNAAAGSGVAVSRWITDPRQLPMFDVAEASLNIKSALATASNCTASNAPTFFGDMANKGAQTSVSVANTFVTLSSLTGHGFLFNVVAPCYDAGTYTPTLEITVDGVVYTITPSTPLASTHRMVWGAITCSESINGVASTGLDIIVPNSGADEGFATANVGNLLGRGQIAIASPDVMLSYGMPCLRFEQSLLIRFKTDQLAGSAGNKIGGASYWVTP